MSIQSHEATTQPRNLFESFPPEILGEIFARVPTRDVFELSKVNHAFREVAKGCHQHCYKQLEQALSKEVFGNIIDRMKATTKSESTMSLVQNIFREKFRIISEKQSFGFGPGIVELFQGRNPSLSVPLHQELQSMLRENVPFRASPNLIYSKHLALDFFLIKTLVHFISTLKENIPQLHETSELFELMHRIENSLIVLLKKKEELFAHNPQGMVLKEQADTLFEQRKDTIDDFFKTYGTNINLEELATVDGIFSRDDIKEKLKNCNLYFDVTNADEMEVVKFQSIQFSLDWFLESLNELLNTSEKNTLNKVLPYFIVFYKRVKDIPRKSYPDSVSNFFGRSGKVVLLLGKKTRSSNAFAVLPEEISSSSQIVSLDCSDCNLSHLPDRTMMPRLRSLDLSDNQDLTYLVNDPERRLPALKELDVEGTQIDVNTLPLYLKNIALKTQLRKQWRRLRDSEFGEGCVGTAFLIAIFVPLIFSFKPTSLSGRLTLEISKIPAKCIISFFKLSFWHAPRVAYRVAVPVILKPIWQKAPVVIKPILKGMSVISRLITVGTWGERLPIHR